MREGWEVWLLPNQATGKQGVPRYIKVDPATDSEEATKTSGVESGGTPEQVERSLRGGGRGVLLDIFVCTFCVGCRPRWYSLLLQKCQKCIACARVGKNVYLHVRKSFHMTQSVENKSLVTR